MIGGFIGAPIGGASFAAIEIVAAAAGIGAATGAGAEVSFLRPDGDTTLGDWTDQADGTSNIYQAIDEASVSDSDFVQSPGGGAPAVPAVIEDAGISTSGSGTVTLPSASAGDLIVVLTLGYSLVFNPTYTSANLTFTQEFYTAFEGAVSWAVAAGTLTNEVITPSAGTVYNTIVLAISGADNSDPFDGSVVSANDDTPETITTTVANTLVIGTMGQNATGTSGWATAITGNYMSAVTKDAVTTGSYTPSFSAVGAPTTTLAIKPAPGALRRATRTVADLKVRLFDGSTQIAEWTHTDISETFTTATQTLTTPQFEAITNISNLFVELDDNQGNIYRFPLANPAKDVIQPVKLRYRYKKLAA